MDKDNTPPFAPRKSSSSEASPNPNPVTPVRTEEAQASRQVSRTPYTPVRQRDYLGNSPRRDAMQYDVSAAAVQAAVDAMNAFNEASSQAEALANIQLPPTEVASVIEVETSQDVTQGSCEAASSGDVHLVDATDIRLRPTLYERITASLQAVSRPSDAHDFAVFLRYVDLMRHHDVVVLQNWNAAKQAARDLLENPVTDVELIDPTHNMEAHIDTVVRRDARTKAKNEKLKKKGDEDARRKKTSAMAPSAEDRRDACSSKHLTPRKSPKPTSPVTSLPKTRLPKSAPVTSSRRGGKRSLEDAPPQQVKKIHVRVETDPSKRKLTFHGCSLNVASRPGVPLSGVKCRYVEMIKSNNMARHTTRYHPTAESVSKKTIDSTDADYAYRKSQWQQQKTQLDMDERLLKKRRDERRKERDAMRRKSGASAAADVAADVEHSDSDSSEDEDEEGKDGYEQP